MSTTVSYLIEFRSGSFFRDLDADRGTSRKDARRFASRAEALRFMRRHDWIVFNGGMVIEDVKK